jgi:hypothetical protein
MSTPLYACFCVPADWSTGAAVEPQPTALSNMLADMQAARMLVVVLTFFMIGKPP